MKKTLFFLFFLAVLFGYSQSKVVSSVCEKKQFFLSHIEDEEVKKAVSLFFSENYEQAFEIVKNYQENKNLINDSFTLLLEADILYKTTSYQKALEAYNNILAIKSVHSDVRFYSLINVGNIYFTHYKKYKESIQYFEKAESILKNSNCQNKQLLVYLGLGNSYLFDKKYKASENLYRKALQINLNKKDAENIARSYSNLANLFYEQYQDTKAESYFLKALKAVENTPHIKVRQQVYFNLYAVNEGLAKYKEALQYLSKSNALKDSIWNRDKVWELAEKDKEISIAKKDKELFAQKEIAEKRKIRLQWGGGILTLVLLFLGTLFYSYKTKVKQNKIITTQKGELEKLNHTKNYLFSVISHDLRSPVKMLIKQQQRFIKKIKEENLPSLQETAGSTLSIAEGLNHLLNNVLHWSLEQNDQMLFEKKVQALYPIVNQVLFDFKLLAEEKQVTIETRLDEEIFLDVDRESLKTILRNLIDNAIKYTSENGMITVSSMVYNDTSTIRVEDSGVGISEEQLERINALQTLSIDKINRSKGVGLGLLLCTTLTQKNGGTFQVKGQLNKGTEVIISFPTVKDIV